MSDMEEIELLMQQEKRRSEGSLLIFVRIVSKFLSVLLNFTKY